MFFFFLPFPPPSLSFDSDVGEFGGIRADSLTFSSLLIPLLPTPSPLRDSPSEVTLIMLGSQNRGRVVMIEASSIMVAGSSFEKPTFP